MKKTKHILHTAKLTNNCPECYGTDGLEFTFSQEMKENILLKRPAKHIDEALVCNNCNTTVYPVSWTTDIERVHKYNRKLAEEKRLSTTIKPLFYILVIVAVILVGGLIYYFTK
jgi:uncharacterized protein YbaR (Trm112 family)